MHIDGASNTQESGTDLILTNLEGVITKYALHFIFKASNNQGEYEALIVNLRVAKEVNMKSLKIFINSQLVAGQAQGEYEARDLVIIRYLQKLHSLKVCFNYLKSFISREQKMPGPTHCLNWRQWNIKNLEGPSLSILISQVLTKPTRSSKSSMSQVR